MAAQECVGVIQRTQLAGRHPVLLGDGISVWSMLLCGLGALVIG